MALFFYLLVRGVLRRVVGDGKLDEKERQERENSRLEEADEYLKHHEGNRTEIGRKVGGNADDDGARENIPEKTEGKRDHTHQLPDKLDNADEESDEIAQGVHDEFLAVLPKPERGDTRHLNDEKGNERERERCV